MTINNSHIQTVSNQWEIPFFTFYTHSVLLSLPISQIYPEHTSIIFRDAFGYFNWFASTICLFHWIYSINIWLYSNNAIILPSASKQPRNCINSSLQESFFFHHQVLLCSKRISRKSVESDCTRSLYTKFCKTLHQIHVGKEVVKENRDTRRYFLKNIQNHLCAQ